MTASTLSDGYDDQTGGAMVRMSTFVYLPLEPFAGLLLACHRWPVPGQCGRIYNAFEKCFSRMSFSRVFLVGDEQQ